MFGELMNDSSVSKLIKGMRAPIPITSMNEIKTDNKIKYKKNNLFFLSSM